MGWLTLQIQAAGGAAICTRSILGYGSLTVLNFDSGKLLQGKLSVSATEERHKQVLNEGLKQGATTSSSSGAGSHS